MVLLFLNGSLHGGVSFASGMAYGRILNGIFHTYPKK